MNYRKFYLILTIVVSFFLFCSGVAVLAYIGNLNSSDITAEGSPVSGKISDVITQYIHGNSPVNFLILVGDKWEANTDSIMLVNFNPNSDNISILSVPRDTKVDMAGLSIPKINSIYAKKDGAKLLAGTLSDMLDVNIKYYVFINLSTFRNIIDLLGGVTINVPVDMDYDDPVQNLHIHLKKGVQRLNGDKAEQFLRFRKPNDGDYKAVQKYYDGSDLKRIQAQQGFVKELIKQKANLATLPKLNDIINTIYNNVHTNLTLSEIFRLVKNVPNINADKINMFTLPGKGISEGYSYFIYDRDEALKITSEYFNASGNFSSYTNSYTKNNSGSSSNSNSSKATPKPTPKVTPSPKPTPTSSGITDVTSNNPSNSDFSVNGSATPVP